MVESQRIYSETLKEYYVVEGDQGILFESGARYSKEEVDKLKGLGKHALVKIHEAKSVFKDSTLTSIKRKYKRISIKDVPWLYS